MSGDDADTAKPGIRRASSYRGTAGRPDEVGTSRSEPESGEDAQVGVAPRSLRDGVAAPYIRDFRCNRCGELCQPFYGEKNTWTHVDWSKPVDHNPEPDSRDINERIRALEAEVKEANVQSDYNYQRWQEETARAERAEARVAEHHSGGYPSVCEDCDATHGRKAREREESL